MATQLEEWRIGEVLAEAISGMGFRNPRGEAINCGCPRLRRKMNEIHPLQAQGDAAIIDSLTDELVASSRKWFTETGNVRQYLPRPVIKWKARLLVIDAIEEAVARWDAIRDLKPVETYQPAVTGRVTYYGPEAS